MSGFGAGIAPAPISPFAGLVLDAPSAGTLTQPFDLTGWAVDAQAFVGRGIDAVHVWAFPTQGGSPIFVGAATVGISRPDVGALIGHRFFSVSGYRLTGASLPSGSYLLVVYARSTVTGAFSWKVVGATSN